MGELRLRKFTAIDREYPIYEIVDGDAVVLDVSRDDAGAYELCVHPRVAGAVYSFGVVSDLLAEAHRLLTEES